MATAPIPAETLQRLKALLGAGGWLEGRDDVEPFLVDHRGLYRGATPLVALPRSTADLDIARRVLVDIQARLGPMPKPAPGPMLKSMSDPNAKLGGVADPVPKPVADL